jgi:hypothetical protein
MCRYFRADAAFANPEVYEFLEVEGYKYAIRLPANQVLQDRIVHLLKRPIGRPSHEVRRFYANFSYQAQSWENDASRRGQGRVASGRALSPCWLRRHQPVTPNRKRHRLLQSARHSRAMDKRRQERYEVDAAVMLHFRL